jgi:2-dehydropantoate 2-reductase
VQGEQVAALDEQGLHCEGLTGDLVVRCFATADPSRSPQADVVLLCASSYATAQAARAAEIILKPDAYCLTLQNGAGNVEQLTAVLGRSRVLAGLSFQSGDLVAPSDVRHTNGGPTYLGELDESRTSRLGHITALFAAGGLKSGGCAEYHHHHLGEVCSQLRY